MGRRKTKRTEIRPGRGLLKAFLEKHKLTFRATAEALQLQHPTVYNWVVGRATPQSHLRKRLEMWTSGEVPESSWELPIESIRVEPLKANGTDA